MGGGGVRHGQALNVKWALLWRPLFLHATHVQYDPDWGQGCPIPGSPFLHPLEIGKFP